MQNLEKIATKNTSDKCLPTRTLLQFLFKYIFFALLSNLVRILHKTSFLTKLQAFLKPKYSWWATPLQYHVSTSTWRMQTTWSIVHLLRRNLCRWFPVISSAYGVNFDKRCWIKSRMYLARMIFVDNYRNIFVAVLINRHNDGLFYCWNSSSLFQTEWISIILISGLILLYSNWKADKCVRIF
jgi:hypothetical protein